MVERAGDAHSRRMGRTAVDSEIADPRARQPPPSPRGRYAQRTTARIVHVVERREAPQMANPRACAPTGVGNKPRRRPMFRPAKITSHAATHVQDANNGSYGVRRNAPRQPADVPGSASAAAHAARACSASPQAGSRRANGGASVCAAAVRAERCRARVLFRQRLRARQRRKGKSGCK